MSAVASPSSIAPSSRSPSPSTPEPSTEPLAKPTIYNEADLSSWYHPQDFGKSIAAWTDCRDFSTSINVKRDESEPMLGLDELLEKHAYEESPSSSSDSTSISESLSYQLPSPRPSAVEPKAISEHRPASILIPSHHGLVSGTKPVPPPASRLHHRDPAANQKVIYPSKDSCINLPIIVPSIPAGGTKSRVETQIRITVDLADVVPSLQDPNKYDRIGSWKWLKLPMGTSTKRQPRKQGKLDPNVDDVLFLNINVACATFPHNPVSCCSSCQIREAKRVAKKIAARVKPERSDSESADETGAKPQQTKKAQHEDTSSIVHFNCAEYLDFSTGTVTLPLRLTCYCRHHREKTGFNVHFSMVDSQGRIVGSGTTRPIMITDDHKTRNTATNTNVSEFHQLTVGADYEWAQSMAKGRKDGSAPSKRRVSSGNIDANGTKRRAKPYDRSRTSREASVSSVPSPSGSNSILPTTRSPSPAPAHFQAVGLETSHDILMDEQLDLGSQHTFERHHSSPDLNILDMFNFSPATMPEPADAVTSPISLSPHQTHQATVTMPPSLPFMFFSQPPQQAVTQPPLALPAIQRLIPACGPTHGGIEVTVLGINFHEGLDLRCVFGDVVASSTQRWSDNTLVCILPPRSSPGVVNVWIEGMNKDAAPGSSTLFTYSDESDRALMELALQVVGLKMTGKIEDAKNVAMRIVGHAGDGNDGSSCSATRPPASTLALAQMRDVHPMLLSSGDPTAFENLILDFMALLDLDLEDDAPRVDVSVQKALCYQTSSGQTLLHLAALSGLEKLIRFLLERGADVNAKDRNGWTPLHFAALLNGKKGSSCSLALLDAGADVQIINAAGNTAQEEAAQYQGSSLVEESSDESTTGLPLDCDEDGWGDGEESEGEMFRPKKTLRRRIRAPGKSTGTSISTPSTKSNPTESPEKADHVNDQEKQAATFVDLIHKTLGQLQQHAPEGLKANMPNFLPHLPYLTDKLAMPNVPWGALPNIPMVFPVFIPMIPGWPAFLSGDQKEAQDGHSDIPGSTSAANANKHAQDWKTVWEKWLNTIPVTTKHVEAPPPQYTPRAEDPNASEKPLPSEIVQAETVGAASRVSVIGPSSHSQRSRRFDYETVPVTDREVDSYAYQPTPKQQQKLRKKHDFMLLVFWLPTLLLSLLWAGIYGLRIALQLMKDVLAARTGAL